MKGNLIILGIPSFLMDRKEFRRYFKLWKVGILKFDDLPSEVQRWIERRFFYVDSKSKSNIQKTSIR